MSEVYIPKLDEREKARKKLPIWYGSVNNYLHGLREVVANSRDEIINNFNDGKINIKLHDDLKTISVHDTGRGVPINGDSDGVPNYELLFETLFAGTKYDESTGDSNTGTNGVGTCVLNYSSEIFIVESNINGKKYRILYSDGGLNPIYEELGDTKDVGSVFTFKLDGSIYPNTMYNKEHIKDLCEHVATTSPNIIIAFECGEESIEYNFKKLQDRYDSIFKETNTVDTICKYDEFSIEIDKNDGSNEKFIENDTVDICFSTNTNPENYAYLNGTYLSNKGKINDGIISGVRSFFNQFNKDEKTKGFKNLKPSDIEDSISFIVNYSTNKVEFENQTKMSTQKVEYHTISKTHVTNILEFLLQTDKKTIEKMNQHIIKIQKSNNTNKSAREKLKKELTNNTSVHEKALKLKDCEDDDIEKNELYITEGDSALACVVDARDSSFQAAIPIRGKIVNCYKNSFIDIISSQVVRDIVSTIGCGIEADKKNKDFDTFDIKNRKYSKIVIAADADEDGRQIVVLLLLMFKKLMPELINREMVFIANTPLYQVRFKDDSVEYFYSESEFNNKKDKLTNVKNIARCKGLGSLESETMSYCAMDKKTRVLTRITVDDVNSMEEQFKKWMDDSVDDRKEYIIENIHKYKNIEE